MDLSKIISVMFVCLFSFVHYAGSKGVVFDRIAGRTDFVKNEFYAPELQPALNEKTDGLGKESNSEPSLFKNSEVLTQRTIDIPDIASLRLKNKIIPLTNPVYQLLDYFETKGELGFLPQAKPYTKIFIAEILIKFVAKDNLSNREKLRVQSQLTDIMQDSNGLKIYKEASENTYAIAGFSAETSVRNGFGDKGTWATSLIGEPYLSGDLGKHITFTAGMGLAVERLTPDIFYQSYTRDNQITVTPGKLAGNQTCSRELSPEQFRH